MFARGAAIRPVPPHAVVERHQIDAVEASLTQDDGAEERLDRAFHHFEVRQPALAARLNRLLSRPLDETALALGYFLGITIFLAFERQFETEGGMRLSEVDDTTIDATEESLALEEELRAARSSEPLEVEDVVAREQPAIVAFLHEHVDAALDLDESGEKDVQPSTRGREVDVDDVDAVYRMMLVVALCLSHAVEPKAGQATRNDELMA